MLSAWYRLSFRYWCRVFIRALGIELYIYQHYRGYLPKQFIVISNHPSAFEDLGMSSLFNARFLAKKEVKSWWIVGRISAAAGTLYVDRNSKTSREDAHKTIMNTLEKGMSVGIYPEGGCKGRRIFTPFQYGIFDIAIKTKMPIVPVFLEYEAQEDFEWSNQHLVYKIWMLFRSINPRANYHICDPIDPTQFTSKEALCDYVQQRYLQYEKKWLD